jgi:Trk K+ transport system NAD-binding subunit
MPFKITKTRLRSILKSPYLVYPATIVTFILIYTELFLVLEENFNFKNADFFTAVYWVIMTMTTTGYGDIYPVTMLGRMFTIVVMVTGILFIFAIVFPLMVTPIMERWLKAPRGGPPDWIKDHVVICGYNALVDSLIGEMSSTGKPFVIIDSSDKNVSTLQRHGYYAILGDSSDEESLQLAQIGKASALIANVGDEKNAAVVITASQMSSCKVIALVESMDTSDYLKFAGAHIVVSPKRILGMNLGMTAISSIDFEATNLVDLGGNMKICKLPIYPDNPMVGKKLKDLKLRENTGATVIAIFKKGRFIVSPPPTIVIEEASVLMAVGTEDQLKKMSSLAKIKVPVCQGEAIIAGFGDVGKEVAIHFDEKKIPYKIIDRKAYPDKDQVVGDAADKQSLIDAGILSASTFIVTLNDDNKNMLATLMARSMNPHISIIARANLDRSVGKIYRAGADYVTSLSTIGGEILARIVEKGVFEDTIMLTENVMLSKFEVKGSLIENRTIKDTAMRSSIGCSIVGYIENGQFYPSPEPSRVIGENMTIIIVGTLKQLQACEQQYGLKKVPE